MDSSLGPTGYLKAGEILVSLSFPSVLSMLGEVLFLYVDMLHTASHKKYLLVTMILCHSPFHSQCLVPDPPKAHKISSHCPSIWSPWIWGAAEPDKDTYPLSEVAAWSMMEHLLVLQAIASHVPTFQDQRWDNDLQECTLARPLIVHASQPYASSSQSCTRAHIYTVKMCLGSLVDCRDPLPNKHWLNLLPLPLTIVHLFGWSTGCQIPACWDYLSQGLCPIIPVREKGRGEGEGRKTESGGDQENHKSQALPWEKMKVSCWQIRSVQ